MMVTPTSMILDVDIYSQVVFNSHVFYFEYLSELDIVRINYKNTITQTLGQRHIMKMVYIKIADMIVYMYSPEECVIGQYKDSQCIPFNAIHLPTNSCIEDVLLRGQQMVRKTCYNYQNPLVLYRYMNEIFMLRQLQHTNIIQMVDNYHVSYSPCILLEKGIPLKTFMMKMVNPMDKIRYEIICLEILRQLCNVVSYLSRNDIIHSDIRVEHIVIIGDSIKLIDFSNAFGTEHEKSEEISECVENKAPEQLLSIYKWTRKVDVWAIGLIALNMLRKNYACVSSNFALLNQSDLTQMIKGYAEVYGYRQIGMVCECFLVVNANKRLMPQTVSRRIEQMHGVVQISAVFNPVNTTDEQIIFSEIKPDHHFV